ncbi:MAG: glutamine synthetase III, partial [Deltaproteobacteria bacterium]|nr:glutamine synthetase III [Deltaproteobacteria bacterium]
MDVTRIFGSNVFNDEIMQNRLPKDTYKALKKTLVSGEPLAP